ncbi:MAG: spore germination protein GerW family protein [bacterium]|nr:spore germination protein GerW family protein [bacterium]
MVIEQLAKTVLSELKRITQTETIVGEPITAGGVTLIPVSRVSVGFGVGGANSKEKNREGEATGGGVLIEPVAFIAISGEKAELLSLRKESVAFGQVVDLIPEVLSKIREMRQTRESAPEKKD